MIIAKRLCLDCPVEIDTSGPGGYLKKRCPKCQVKYEKEYNKKWDKEHPEQVKEYKKKYYKEHSEQIKENNKKWAKKHPEQVKEYKKKWRKANPENNKKYYKKHSEQFKEYNKKWCKENPEKKKEIQKKWERKNPERLWARNSRQSHIHSGFNFKNIPIDYLENLAKKIRTCRYCNIPLNYASHNGHKMDGPALDRIDNKKGMLLPKDVQIICCRCSIGKGKKNDQEYLAHLEKGKRINAM